MIALDSENVIFLIKNISFFSLSIKIAMLKKINLLARSSLLVCFLTFLSLSSSAQKTITGTFTTNAHHLIKMATVHVQGPSTETLTNLVGMYSIRLTKYKSPLVVSVIRSES